MTDGEPFEEIMGLGAGVDHYAVRGKLLLLALYAGGALHLAPSPTSLPSLLRLQCSLRIPSSDWRASRTASVCLRQQSSLTLHVERGDSQGLPFGAKTKALPFVRFSWTLE